MANAMAGQANSLGLRELKLIDDETGRVFVFHLSASNFTRANNDIYYCTKLLSDAKNLQDTENAAMEQNVSVEGNESEEGNGVGEENETIEKTETIEKDETADENETTEEKAAGEKFSSDVHNDDYRWVDGAVRLLLAVFKQKEDLLHSGKLSVKKFWELISTEMAKKGYQITGPKCKSKLYGLKKIYKNVKDHNGKSGNNRRLWPYLELMDAMFDHKPWVRSSSTLDSAKMSSPSPAGSSDGTSASPPASEQPCKRSLFSTNRTSQSPPPGERPYKRQKVSHESATDKLLLNIQQNREDRKKMHEDAMSRQDRLLALLEKIAEKE